MCAAREMLGRVLLSTRVVRFSVLNSWETPGSGISDLLPYSSSLTGFTLSTMSKGQLLQRMESRSGNSRSSSMSHGAGGDGGKSDTKQSVWGSKPKMMSKAEFRKRLEKLTAKPKATAETTVGDMKRGSVWKNEYGQFPKTMTKEEFRKRLYLWREGHLPPTDESSEAEGVKQEARQSAETANSDSTPSDGEDKKNEDTGSEEKKQEGGASHGLWERLQAIYR